MDIREYFQKEQKGFYRIIAENLTVERRKQLYDAINEWHESELKLLGIADVSGSLFDFVQECDRMISLYKNQRYTQAEQLRDKLSERLDDVMRGY